MPEAVADNSAAEKPVLVYVVHSLDPGGTERLATDMALAFAKEYDVRVVCLDRPGLWASFLRAQSIPVYCLYRQPGFDPSVPLNLSRLLRKWRARIVHAHQCTPWFYSGLARLLHRRPRLLLEEHGRFFPEARSPLRAAIHGQLVRRLTHSFVAVSADIRTRLAAYEGLREADIQVVYNGVAPNAALEEAARATLRRDLGAGDGEFLVVTVGRLDSIKNLPMFVRGLAEAARAIPRLRAAIVGDGPERTRIEDALRKADLLGRVRMTGFRSDARQIAQVSDLFVLTSFSEGTSMALLEAMSAGVPAAVTAVGGNVEIIRNGINGWLIPSDDSSALATIIHLIDANPQVARQVGATAQRDFASRFSFDRMVAQYRGLYRELLNPTNRPAPLPSSSSQ